MAQQITELAVEQLRHRFDPAGLKFNSTAELPALAGIIGQERAMRAISFGINIRSHGYHMYALGPVGTGKKTIIRNFLAADAAQKPVPDDWLYVNNFNDSGKPKALRLTAGKGREFRDDMDQLVEELKTEVPKAFESNEYQQERQEIQRQFQKRSQDLFENLEEKVKAAGFRLLHGPQGIGIFPARNGEIISPDELAKLDEKERAEILERQQGLEEHIHQTMRQVQDLQKEGKKRMRELDRKVVGYAVDHLLNELKERYAEFDKAVEFLDEARAFLLKHVHSFKQMKQLEEASPQQQQMVAMTQGGQPSFDEYRVNLIVDHSGARGAPVIFEKNPTGPNLLGRIEHQGQFGALVTNFSMIKSGALHLANGGYLIIDAFDLLTKPLAWEVLKRALKNEEVVIESMQQAFGFLTTRTLEPEPIPLHIKVILVGDPFLYYLLFRLDDDFQELFKVKADFDNRTARTPETVEHYARFIGKICREENLRHFSPAGVAKVVEFSTRLAAHQQKLTTRFGEVVDLVREASFWAGEHGNDPVQGGDVQQAVDEKIFRSNRIEQIIQETIEEGTILIDTADRVVGQVNGIAVLALGDYAFGKPSRITARTHVGNKGLLNIDREAKLGGPIHNKGSLILAGYLGGRYAGQGPLALSASITFEQLYEEVEGDSASSTELYALLSSLAGLPIRQDLAVTGSVNQHGEIQAIGGVNEKIEGFFEICRRQGLTGTQGVLIPPSNVKHLMLREKVVEAVQAARFHIYPITHIDQGIALLTGKEAGELREDGTYPADTVNWYVQQKILELAEKVRAFGNNGKNSEEEE